MTEQIVNLTGEFNATVKKGGLFKLVLGEGGINPTFSTVKVTSGEATLVREANEPAPFVLHERVYRADAPGSDGTIALEVTSEEVLTHRQSKQTFKIRVQ